MPVFRLEDHDFYKKRFLKFGSSYLYSGWENKIQQLRSYHHVYHSLRPDLWKKPETLLDIGCGLGDFYKFCLNAEPKIKNMNNFEYLGVDKCEQAIAMSQIKHGDIFLPIKYQDLKDRQFDHVVCLGGMNHTNQIPVIDELFQLVKKTLHIQLFYDHKFLPTITQDFVQEMIYNFKQINGFRYIENSLIIRMEKSN